MNIELERIQAADHKYISDLLHFYQESFPPEERRESEMLLSMLSENSMFFSAVSCGSVLVGMVVYWRFDGFIYIEHLAVWNEQRGKGIGGAILQKLREKSDPVLLEVEIPHDEASSRRVQFYNRSGFAPLPLDYFQPPYREGEAVLPMMLFSNCQEWEPEELRQTIELFQNHVYYSRIKG